MRHESVFVDHWAKLEESWQADLPLMTPLTLSGLKYRAESRYSQSGCGEAGALEQDNFVELQLAKWTS